MVISEQPLTMPRDATVDADMIREAARRLGPTNIDPTRKLLRKKWDILTGNVQAHAKERLIGQYSSDVAQQGTEAQISRTMNPAQDIVHRICQVYQHGVRRSVSGIGKKKNKALQQLYREAGAASMGQDWNREAYFVGPDTVIPRVRDGRMTLDTVVPHRRIPILNEQDPLGKPVGVIYEASRNGDWCTLVSVDQRRVVTWTVAPGNVVEALLEVQSDALREKASPFATLRFDQPRDPCDYDSSHRHQRLADGTVDVVVVAAVMGHVRKTQNKQLLFVQGALEALAKGQNLGDPDKPVFLPTPSGQPNALQLGKVDFDQPVESFIAHMRFFYAALAESTGVPAMISLEGPIDLQFAYDGLSEERDAQIVFVDEFERDLACAMVLAARDGGHPLADDLPTVEEVKRGFGVLYGKMSRRLSDPLMEQQALDWEIRHGLLSVLDLLAKKYPEKDEDALLTQLKETLELNTQYWDFMARTNMAGEDPGNGASVDSSGKVVNAAQANGARGGRPSGSQDRKGKALANGRPSGTQAQGKSGSTGGSAGKPGRARAGGAPAGRSRGAEEGAGRPAKAGQGARGRKEGNGARQALGAGKDPGGTGRAPGGARPVRQRTWLAA